MHGLFRVMLAGLASVAPGRLLLLAGMVLLIKELHTDMANTRIERDVRRLHQRLALLGVNLESLRVSEKPVGLSNFPGAFPT